DLDGAQRVVRRPPGADHEQGQQQHGHQAGETLLHWMLPPSGDRVAVKQASMRPWAARIRSQHSRTAPAPPRWVETQCAAWLTYRGALGTLAANPTRRRTGRSMMSSPM